MNDDYLKSALTYWRFWYVAAMLKATKNSAYIPFDWKRLKGKQ
jgi:hypothetical protein